jgi:hypothetical protein
MTYKVFWNVTLCGLVDVYRRFRKDIASIVVVGEEFEVENL